MSDEEVFSREELVKLFRDHGYEVRSKLGGTVRVNRSGLSYLYIPMRRTYRATDYLEARTSREWRELNKVDHQTGRWIDSSTHRTRDHLDWKSLNSRLGRWLEVRGYVQFEQLMIEVWTSARRREEGRSKVRELQREVESLGTLVANMTQDPERDWRCKLKQSLDYPEVNQARDLLGQARLRVQAMYEQARSEYFDTFGELP